MERNSKRTVVRLKGDDRNTRLFERLRLSEKTWASLDLVSQVPMEFAARLLLLDCPGFGDVRLNTLIRRFGQASAILSRSAPELRNVRGIGINLQNTLLTHRPAYFDSDHFWSELQRMCGGGARLAMVGDKTYPDSLTKLSTSPPLIWILGDKEAFHPRTVSVVGTRRPTPDGRKVAYDLGYALATAGYTVVSGLAYGIDAEAHRGALDAGGRTIAVLGSGFLRMYPYAHRGLSERIIESGAIVSEFPLLSGAKPGHFPRRNRIISGLSGATVIVEAYEKGGALITGRLALDQNRDVLAFPGRPSCPAARGTNMLIRSGEAEMVLTVGEVVAYVESMSGSESDPRPRERRHGNATPEKKSSQLILDADACKDRPSISSSHQNVPGLLMSILSVNATHISELPGLVNARRRRQIRLPEALEVQNNNSEEQHSAVSLGLLRLENAGLVRRLPGGYYIAKGQKK